jgi:hypothetical protein
MRGSGPPGWKSLETERVEYCRESRETRTQELPRWRGPAVVVNDRSVLSSEIILHKDCGRRGSTKESCCKPQGFWHRD